MYLAKLVSIATLIGVLAALRTYPESASMDDFGKTMHGSNKKPIVHRSIGIVVKPTTDVFSSNAHWKHLIRIPLPCVETLIDRNQLSSLNDSLIIIKDLIVGLSKLELKGSEKDVLTMLRTKYKYYRVNLLAFQKSMLELNTKTQYAWGALPYDTCAKQSYQKDSTIDSDDDDNLSRKKRDTTFTGNTIHGLHLYSGIYPSKQTRPHEDTIHAPRATESPKPHTITPDTVKTYTQRSPRLRDDSDRFNHQDQHYAPTKVNHLDDDENDKDMVMADQSGNRGAGVLQGYTKFQEDVVRHLSSDKTSLELTICRYVIDDSSGLPTKLCSTQWVKPDHRQLEYRASLKFKGVPLIGNVRHRRSLCAWCGKAYSWLFGLTSHDDLMDITKSIEKDLEIKTTKINELVSGQKIVIKTLSDQISGTARALSTLDNRVSELKDIATSVQKYLATISSDVQKNYLLDYLHSTLSTYIDYINTCRNKVFDIEKFYRSIKTTITNKRVDLELITGIDLQTITRNINRILPDDYEIIPTWSDLKELDDKSISLFTDDHDLLIVYDIPLRKTSTDYSTWKISKLPVDISGQKTRNMSSTFPTLEVVIGDDHFIMDRTNKVWAPINKIEWSMCISGVGRTCPDLLQWQTIHALDCIPSLILPVNPDLIAKQCPVSLKHEIASIQATTVDSTHWLVTVIGKPFPTSQICEGGLSNNPGSSQSSYISGLNLFEIDPGCKMQVGSFLFEGRKQFNSESSSMINLKPFMPLNNESIPQIIVQSIPGPITNEDLQKLDHALDAIASNDTLFQHGLTTMEQLGERLKNLPTITAIDSSESYVKQAIKNLQHKIDAGINIDWPFMGGSVITIICTIVILILVIRCIARRKIKTAASLAIPLTQPKMHAFAASNLLQVIDKVSTSATLEVSGNQTVVSLHNTIKDHFPWINICLMSVMISLMLYCMYQYHKVLAYRLNRLIACFGIYPLNVAIAHHAGESPICVTVLIKFISIFGKSSMHEIGCQVGTLPHPASQWYCNQEANGITALIPVVTSRISRYLTFKIDWYAICIKSNLGNIESCTAMPEIIKIQLDDVLNQIYGNLPWFWIKVRPLSITHVFVGQGPGKREIYSYLYTDNGFLTP